MSRGTKVDERKNEEAARALERIEADIQHHRAQVKTFQTWYSGGRLHASISLEYEDDDDTQTDSR